MHACKNLPLLAGNPSRNLGPSWAAQHIRWKINSSLDQPISSCCIAPADADFFNAKLKLFKYKQTFLNIFIYSLNKSKTHDALIYITNKALSPEWQDYEYRDFICIIQTKWCNNSNSTIKVAIPNESL